MKVETSPDYHHNTAWSTNEELLWINNIGATLSSPYSKQKLLENYITAAMSRIYWCGVDYESCIKHASSLLNTQLEGY